MLTAVRTALSQLARKTDGLGDTLAIAGTSGSFLSLGVAERPVAEISLYSDRTSHVLEQSVQTVMSDHVAMGASSSVVARVVEALRKPKIHAIAFEADYFASVLAGTRLPTDLNSALKAGADPVTEEWTPWTGCLGVNVDAFPPLVRPGQVLGQMTKSIAQELGFVTRPQIVSGTTDGCASALAAGLERTGDAVTSLGSTLTLKILSDRPVQSVSRGVYSHRILGRWLVGGASNSGGRVLRHLFNNADLVSLSRLPIAPSPSTLRYVPLLSSGERFPVVDPYLLPCLTPRPSDDVAYFHAILDSLVRWERRGFTALTAVGAPAFLKLTAVGGGVRNTAWMATRRRDLKIDHFIPKSTQPAFGAASLGRYAVSDVLTVSR
jgi:sugar (pentulose or hexulose) kinase